MIYYVRCMGMPCGNVTASRAAEMFVSNPNGRTGDLESGFSYWITGRQVRRLVRVDVDPAPAVDVEPPPRVDHAT